MFSFSFLKKIIQKHFFDVLVFLFFFLLPFGTKKFLFSLEGREITSEMDGAFLFLNDIWLSIFLLIFLLFLRKRALTLPSFWKRWIIFALTIFLGVSFLSAVFSPHTALSIYSFVRLFLGMLLGFCVCKIVQYSKLFSVAWGIFVSSVVQSIIGASQFITGKSVGLKYFGEVVVDEATRQVARTSIDGALFLRAYGTMQHANILAAFLVIGFLAGVFLLFYSFRSGEKKIFRLATLSGGLFVVTLGIAVTFSRSGWITFALSTLLFLSLLIFSPESRKIGVRVFITCVIIFSAVMMVFGWAIVPRASFEDGEPSVDLRVDYLHIGRAIVLENPLIGVGIGNQVEYAREKGLYGAFGVERTRDHQPIHNIFLLALSEIGLIGGIPLGLFFVYLFTLSLKSRKDARVVWLSSSLVGFFTLGMFDHFFWTTQSGIAMFWVVAFLLLFLTKEEG